MAGHLMADGIVIVGGGPAGSTLALRLARLGHAVTVVERSPAAHPGDGESLHPGIWPLLDSLGVSNPGGLPVDRMLVRWGSDEVVEQRHRAPSLAVLRPHFDTCLLDLARSAGANVRQPAALDDVSTVNACFVVDASGRAQWSRTSRRRTSEPTLAMRGTWRGAGLPREARVEALEEGWIWGSPMPDGSFACIACVDTPADYFELLAKSLLFRELRNAGRVAASGEQEATADGALAATVHHHDATTYAADVVAEERLLRVGDASHSLDPLSSSGVRSAMQSALHASIVIHTILRHPDRAALALQFYETTQRAAVTEHTAWTRAFYAESRFRDQPFWSRRAAPAAPPSVLAAGDAVALAPAVTIEDVPCIVGDVIEPRRGVTGASVARPFVWIGGVEAARLLEPLANRAMSRDELFAHWRGLTQPGRESALFEELVRSGVIAGRVELSA
jgi:2-polyprenyl-6-methoxyphenol hydroxylase-like FAD-dependent oxidoreductase